jgi:hypothetical protein
MRSIIVVSIVPLVLGMFNWKRLNKPLKIFWYFLLVSIILYFIEQLFFWSAKHHRDFWIPILTYFSISTTNFLRYPYQINNFLLLGWFLYLILPAGRWAASLRLLSFGFAIAVSIHYFFMQGYQLAGGPSSTASALYCFAVPLLSMWYLYHEDSKVPLSHNPYFWINLGLIIPNLLGLFLYFAGDEINKEDFTLYAQLTIAKNCIEMIAQILTAIGFYYARNVKFFTQN